MLSDGPRRERQVALGVHLLTYGSTWPRVLETARAADRLGYDYLFGADHLFATGGDPFEPFFEGWTTLAAWAQATERIRLGLLVGANAFRHPALVAKMTATVDHVSGGRAVLGLGAGWYDAELLAHGLETGSGIGERLAWLDEALAIVTRLLAGETLDHQGPRYRLEGVRHAPAPLQRRVPVLVGASGERRGLRIVARHADLWQSWVSIDDVVPFRRRDEALRRHCLELGRDEAAITRVIGAKVVLRDDPGAARQAFEDQVRAHGWPDEVRDHAWLGDAETLAAGVERYRALGARLFLLQLAEPYDAETLERFVRDVPARLS